MKRRQFITLLGGAALAIPVHSDLQGILDAGPGEHLTFIVGQARPTLHRQRLLEVVPRPMRCGWPAACSAHGLRKAACRRLAEAGCSANEIAAINGHASLREVERYTRAADQERTARNAMARRRG